MRPIVLMFALAGLAACANNPSAVTPATEAQQAQLLDRVKSLSGTWTMAGPDGTQGVASIFAVSSNGSVVREIMFPGAEHEMTNLYHMDGSSLILTHYCAAGNQPRMRSAPTGGDALTFEFDSVTNLTSPDDTYMGSMRLVFVDSNHIRQEWVSLRKGVEDHHATFELTRQE